jgi:hypothetical protein
MVSLNMLVKYEVGMRVRDRWDRKYLGEVTKVVDEDEIHVKWDHSTISRHDPSEIAPYDPEGDKARAIITQAKIDEATHSLEAAFKALREANALELGSDDYEGAYALHGNDDLDLSKLEDVVNRNGWSTSSLYC